MATQKFQGIQHLHLAPVYTRHASDTHTCMEANTHICKIIRTKQTNKQTDKQTSMAHLSQREPRRSSAALTTDWKAFPAHPACQVLNTTHEMLFLQRANCKETQTSWAFISNPSWYARDQALALRILGKILALQKCSTVSAPFFPSSSYSLESGKQNRDTSLSDIPTNTGK